MIFNKFIWGRKNPRIKFAIAGKRFHDVGIAIPNVRRYHKAALLVACVEWNRMTEDDIFLMTEQDGYMVKLYTWLFSQSANRSDMEGLNDLVRTLGRVWLTYKKLLIPQGSPLQNFVDMFGSVGLAPTSRIG